jgi:hypothetical protein
MGGFIATARNALPRVAIFFVFGLVLSGKKPADLVVGALTAIAATWVSLRLLSAGQWSLGAVALARLVLRFASASRTPLHARHRSRPNGCFACSKRDSFVKPGGNEP